MNKQKIHELADYIESGQMPYRQENCYFCIAAQAWELFGESLENVAGLSTAQWERIYDPWPAGYAHAQNFPQREDAVAMLRQFAETGEVRWKV